MLNLTAHGNLGKDPETKEINDTQVASFSLAASTGKDRITWIECTVWGKKAEIAMRYLRKGDKITVAGSGTIDTYTNREGNEIRSLKLRVSDFTLPPKREEPDLPPF